MKTPSTSLGFVLPFVCGAFVLGCSDSFTAAADTHDASGSDASLDAGKDAAITNSTDGGQEAATSQDTGIPSSHDAAPDMGVDGSPADVADTGLADSHKCEATLTPQKDSCVLNESLGVFVSSSLGSDTSGNGSRKAPYKTLSKALSVARSKELRVYACAESFNESVVFPPAVSVFGSLDCTAGSWQWREDRRSAVNAPVGSPWAMKIMPKTGSIEIHDFEFNAADATSPGGASIAGWIENASKIRIERSIFRAGKGAAGASQAAATVGNAGIPGNSGLEVEDCYPNPQDPYAHAVELQCPTGGSSTGGGSGQNGLPAYASSPNAGKGGAFGCAHGTAGAAGVDGLPGQSVEKIGTVVNDTYTPVDGLGGKAGSPGQGGGGGGSTGDAGGGGGGTGGCGGPGGLGGKGGGASIGLVVLQNNGILMRDCMIIAGTGGAGAPGQAGGRGGEPGPGKQGIKGGACSSIGSPPSCNGAAGGYGGNGGAGAGGNGGPSVAVWWNGICHPSDGAVNVKLIAGAGGAGGKAVNSNPDLGPITVAGNAGISLESYHQK